MRMYKIWTLDSRLDSGSWTGIQPTMSNSFAVQSALTSQSLHLFSDISHRDNHSARDFHYSVLLHSIGNKNQEMFLTHAHVLLDNIRGTESSLQVTSCQLTTLILHYVDIHRKQQNLTYSSAAAPGKYSQLAEQKTQSKYTVSVYSQVHVSFV